MNLQSADWPQPHGSSLLRYGVHSYPDDVGSQKVELHVLSFKRFYIEAICIHLS